MKKSSSFLENYVVVFFDDFQSFDDFVNMTDFQRYDYLNSDSDVFYLFLQAYSVGSIECILLSDYVCKYYFIYHFKEC